MNIFFFLQNDESGGGDNQEGQKNGWVLKPCSYVFCKFQKKESQISIYEGACHRDRAFSTYLNGD